MDNSVKRIYVDNAATTPVSREVIEAMMPCFTEVWGNPSSLHEDGQSAKAVVDAARETIANAIGCDASEIYFTSCGSESDNWAIKGAAYAARGRKKIVTSKIEHHAVLHTCEALEKEGYEIVYVGVDEGGFIRMDELCAAVDENTALVAVMMANNEIGTIEPIKAISDVAHAHGALMFTDAVQAVGNIPVNVKELGVDMLSLSGHKIHTPKGIGALYIRKGVRIKNPDTGDSRTLSVDGIFVAIGQVPENEPFADVVKLNDYGYVTAGEDCKPESCHPGIFVAGDCRTKAIRQVTTATADGAVAALSACRYIDSL